MNNEEKLKDFLDNSTYYGTFQLSWGTLKITDLCDKATDFIEYMKFDLDEDLKRQIKKFKAMSRIIWQWEYDIPQEKYEKYRDLFETNCYYLWEDIFDFFNEVCPEGYYFGSTEGDGADFGFWRYEGEE